MPCELLNLASRLSEVRNFLVINSTSRGSRLDEPGTPEYLASLWIADTDERNVPLSDTYFVQRYNMAVLYYAAGGEKWRNNQGWLGSSLECNWYGVNDSSNGCSQSEIVSSIRLQENNLRGVIPAEIGGLPNLQHLDLSSNCLVGAIPSEIGNLKELRVLRFEDNDLIGTIPPEVLAMASLTELYFYYNDFVGKVPESSAICDSRGEGQLYSEMDCEQCPNWISILNGGPCCTRCYYAWADPHCRK